MLRNSPFPTFLSLRNSQLAIPHRLKSELHGQTFLSLHSMASFSFSSLSSSLSVKHPLIVTATCHYHLPLSRLNLHQRFTLSLSLSLSLSHTYGSTDLTETHFGWFQSVGFNWLSGSSFGFVVKLISMVVGRQGVRQWLRVSELKWRSKGEEGLKEAWVAAEEMRDLGLDNSYIYIYRGYFCNFKVPSFYLGPVSGRVSDFFNKTRTRFGFLFLFFKLIPNPIPNQTV